MRITELFTCFAVISVIALGVSVPVAKSQENIRQIEIHSGWGGLGTPQNTDVFIRSKDGTFIRDGKRVDAAQVHALVSALQAPRTLQPDMDNLGVTLAWLKEQVKSQRPRARTQALRTTAKQQELFTTSFTNPDLIAKVLPELFEFSRTDDYPFVDVEVTFENGSKIKASSHSYYVYMLPWTFDGKNDESYNVDISRAVSALLPPKTVNKDRLGGGDFLKELVDAVMGSIETQWNLLGTEDRAGDALRALRTAYSVERADINPYHNVDYGIPWSTKGPHETNLHVTLRKSSFPPNFLEELILLYDQDRVQGVEEFLKTGAKYEGLALSVPWLNDYVREHPKENVFLMHVHDTSFGDQAMRTFTLDMKARGREDLISPVQAHQAQIALLKIGYVYWLVFPDKHMMLWRYDGPSGFLKWKQTDFPAGLCGAYPVNNGGCSGREVSADGTLMSEPPPRDRTCMATNHQTGHIDARPDADLFPVMDHDRAGFIDHTGKIVIPLCFDKVGAFADGLARFERDGNWGYIDSSGAVIIEPKFPWAEEFSEGLARVQISGQPLGYNGRWGFINKFGKVVIPPDYKATFGGKSNIGADDAEDSFHDGLAKIEIHGKTGFIDQTGKVVVPAEFTYAYPFSEGLAAVTKSSTGDDGWGYIDITGKWIIAAQFAWASSFAGDMAPVNSGRGCEYIDTTGASVLKPPAPLGKTDCAEVWGDFSEGLSRWKFGKKYGYIDSSGKVVIKPRFDLTFHFSEGLAAVEIGGKWGYIDKAGKMVIAPKDLEHVEDFRHGLAFVTTKDGKYGYIDSSGKYVWTPTLLYID